MPTIVNQACKNPLLAFVLGALAMLEGCSKRSDVPDFDLIGLAPIAAKVTRSHEDGVNVGTFVCSKEYFAKWLSSSDSYYVVMSREEEERQRIEGGILRSLNPASYQIFLEGAYVSSDIKIHLRVSTTKAEGGLVRVLIEWSHI